MDANQPGRPTPQKPIVIDWREVRQRQEAACAAAERIWVPTLEETQRTLKARAQVLAREPVSVEAADGYIEVVEFFLAHERYAIGLTFVREVALVENLTPLPCTPAFVLGIVNLRGKILSVIDIGRFFDFPKKGLTDLNKIVVLQNDTMVFGILADAIGGVRRISLAGIQPSLPTLTGIREDYLKGVTAERTVILDAARLLTDEGIIVKE